MKVEGCDVDVEPDDVLPSVEMTMRFLVLCDRYGSEEAAVAAIVRGRRTSVPELPVRDDWPAWNAAEMRAAVEFLQEAGAGLTEFGAPHR